MFTSAQNALSIFGVIIVVAIANPYFLLPVLVLSIFFFFVREVYLKTSKDVKRLEGMSKRIKEFRNISKFSGIDNFEDTFHYFLAKSPAFTHLNATLSGLSTVRACNSQAILQREFDNLQDTHTACWYIYVTSVAVFGLSLDTLSTIFITCIVFYYILFDTKGSGDKIGLAISQAM